jgi:nitroreductase
MDIIEAIKTRKSCRTFAPVSLKSTHRKILQEYITENMKTIDDEIIELNIIEKKEDDEKMKLNYGSIKGHNTYVLGKSKSTVDSRVHYGYLMEKVVLKATEIGLSTCWIGYFDHTYFNEMRIEPGYEIPSLVIVGYSSQKPSALDRLSRFAVKASKRKEWKELFFEYPSGMPLHPDLTGKYATSLEMVRLSPSAGNTQPWRIFFDHRLNEFHFFKKPVSESYEKRGLHDIDLGISLSHFELASSINHQAGKWTKQSVETVVATDDLQYIITWKCM